MQRETGIGGAVSRVAALTAAYLALAWAGIASYAASNVHDYPFNESLSVGQVFGDMVGLSIGDLSSAIADSFFPLLNEIMLISFVVAVFAVGGRTINRVLLTIAAGITVPYGLLGILAGVGPFDGEWVGEGWAGLACFSIWSVLLAVTAAVQFRGLLARPGRLASA